MSISTLDSTQSQRMLAERESYSVRMAAEVARLSNSVAAVAAECDPYAPCKDLPMEREYIRGVDWENCPFVYQTLGDVLANALDSTKRPDFDTAMALICRAARGDDVKADAAAMLQALCDRIGEQHAEVE
jgi:hypothetical protein